MATTLEKVYSREHTLFYVYVWNNSDLLAYDIKNLLFIKEKQNNIVSVYYNQNELNGLLDEIAEKLNSNPGYFANIKQKFDHYLDLIAPYLQRKKRLTNLLELKDYFNNLVQWWSVMAITAAVPDRQKLNDDIRQKLLRMREETEAYTSQADNLFVEYFRANFPQCQNLTFLITPDEVFRLGTGALPEDKIKSIAGRAAGYALINNELISLDELENELKENDQLLAEKNIETKKLEGEVAYRGKVTGAVRVILLKEELGTIQEGEILVSSMTTPLFLPAMKKAVAFVTDEGGITCHAAIVARELKKPCIVGTKFATRALKNGDLVEVDANKGVVTILEK